MADLTGMLQAAAGSGGGGPWDVAGAVYNGTPINRFSVAAQDTFPNGLFFKPDGIKMYVVGFTDQDVNEYDLSVAWDISSAVFLQNFSVAAQDTTPTGLFFKPDGTKMYVAGETFDYVIEYDLSSAWDISSAVFLQTFSFAAQETFPRSVFFKPDGIKMYVAGSTGDAVNEYDLSSAWDISSAVFLQTFSVAAQDTTPTGLFFKSDGTKMYVAGSTGDDVNEYDLSSAWDISSAVFLQNFSVAAQDALPRGLFFKPDGTKMYVVGANEDTVNEYDLSSAWDISSASFTNPTTEYFSVAAQETSPEDVFFKPDGTKMYVVGSTGDDVNEYDLSVAWDVSSASFLQAKSISAQETSPTGVFFKPDGTKMYVVGASGDDVNEYDLSVAWDVSSASFLQAKSISAQETSPTGVFFKPDGTKMYVVGASGDDVNEYDLSVAWDVTTAVFSQTFSVAAQDTTPTGLFFKPNGTKMYVVGIISDNVNEYDLSVAWDISSAVFLQTFSVAAQDILPQSVFFKPDGTKMYVIGATGDAVWSYDL